MQVQDTNQSASEVESSFNHHRAMFTNNLSATLDSTTLKENEYKSIECLSANTSIFETLSRRQDYDECQSVTENHREIYLLDKVIKLSKRLLKSKLLRSSNEIKMTANHMKNARYIKSVK